MSVVSVRIAEDDLQFLRQHKLNISKVARQAVHEAVRRMQFQEDLAFLRKNRLTPDESSQDVVRRERDRR